MTMYFNSEFLLQELRILIFFPVVVRLLGFVICEAPEVDDDDSGPLPLPFCFEFAAAAAAFVFL